MIRSTLQEYGDLEYASGGYGTGALVLSCKEFRVKDSCRRLYSCTIISLEGEELFYHIIICMDL